MATNQIEPMLSPWPRDTNRADSHPGEVPNLLVTESEQLTPRLAVHELRWNIRVLSKCLTCPQHNQGNRNSISF